jgi:hypothetical protein
MNKLISLNPQVRFKDLLGYLIVIFMAYLLVSFGIELLTKGMFILSVL